MAQVHIVGVLNVTPDSFHDGGKFTSVDAALQRAGQMLQEGADVLEIGGESTGPTSKDVSPEEELRRILPVVQAIRGAYPAAMLCVDTYKPAVARAALAEGAMMINDVTAGRGDPSFHPGQVPDMFRAVAESDARLVLMYGKDATPRTTVEGRRYDDVVAAVSEFLRARKALAVSSGIPAERIILDPGLGHFVSADARYSFEILRRLREFEALGSPLLVSPSRKSFLAGAENLPAADRLPGTIAASAIAVLNGATYIRTHDVKDIRRACDISQKICQGGKGGSVRGTP